eukprot:1145378-Pelagomonas_calceolata.AAC.2
MIREVRTSMQAVQSPDPVCDRHRSRLAAKSLHPYCMLPNSYTLVACCWSPSRPAVVYLTDQAGNLEVWDLLDRSHEPSIKGMSSPSRCGWTHCGVGVDAWTCMHQQFSPSS